RKEVKEPGAVGSYLMNVDVGITGLDELVDLGNDRLGKRSTNDLFTDQLTIDVPGRLLEVRRQRQLDKEVAGNARVRPPLQRGINSSIAIGTPADVDLPVGGFAGAAALVETLDHR